MQVTQEALSQAVRRSNAILREHGITTSQYLNLSGEAKRLIAESLVQVIPDPPRTKGKLRKAMLDSCETGILIGIEIARERIEARD